MTTPQPGDFLIGELNSVPLFIATDEHALSIIESDPANDIYYVIAGHDILYKDTANTQVKKTNTGVYLVRKNILSRTVTLIEAKEVGVKQTLVTKSTSFLLPKMPWEFVQKLDSFFRKVEQLHGTEAIVILTFDPSCLDSEDPGAGWGCMVPKQKNTGGHCNYDPPSVMAAKPENVRIVGSVHSHPSMPAYASGIDHKDQDDNPGLHITFGWPSQGNKLPTEYYFEIISEGGDRFTDLTVNDVFASAPLPDCDVSVIDTWIENVTKSTGTVVHHGTPLGSGMSGMGTANNTVGSTYIAAAKKRTIKLPANAPSPKDHMIIGTVNELDPMCPFCSLPLGRQFIDARTCSACKSYFVLEGESITDLMIVRNLLGKYSLEIDPMHAPHPITIWYRDANGDDAFTDDVRLDNANPK